MLGPNGYKNLHPDTQIYPAIPGVLDPEPGDMPLIPMKNIITFRKRHNEDIVRRMRVGEPLTRYDSHDSWFPVRPVIKKDPKAIRQLYPQWTPSKIK